MTHRKNKNLHVVRAPERRRVRLTDEIAAELNRGDDSAAEGYVKQTRRRKRTKRKMLTGFVSVAAVIVVIFLFIHLQTCTSVNISDIYSDKNAASASYEQFAGGVLKYTRDGISYLNQKGEEQWNQPYQIKNPFVEVNGESAAVADKGGNDIFVFQKQGVKGEIHTTMPIQKLEVSEQGIVCVILKNEDAPKIICYDTTGNVLVEHKTSLNGTGYPLDVSISPDGKVMQAAYLYTQDGKITSKVAYYNFGEAGEGKADRQVTYKEYEGTIMAQGFFLSQNTSVAVGNNLLTVYKGRDIPEEKVSVKIDKEIKGVFHNNRYIGMVLKNEGKGGYELRLYNASGRRVMSKDFTGEYSNMKVCGSQVIMYDGKQCAIFMRTGVQKFKGEMSNPILEIFPITGVNKYIVMNANGMEHIRLVK